MFKSPRLWLRIASILTFLLAAAHTAGGMQSWSPAGETEVLRAMRSFRFDAEGVSRTYLDFYLGFGFLISVLLVAQGVILWQLSSSRIASVGTRPVICTFIAASAVAAILSWRFIFMIPVISFVLIAASLTIAFVVSGVGGSAQAP